MIDKLDGLSLDLRNVNKDKLKSVFPECFTEGMLDIDKLLSLCGEYIDNDFEKYKFEWKGKAECLRLAQKRSTGTLRPCKEESVNFDETQNLYLEGDNLEVLKLLQTAYYGKVKMIYIDPPYNTGNDFVYEDDFKDPLARYKEITQQTTKSNPETMGRFHTNWLNMMYPRLRLAANLLRDDGVIFISIDDNEQYNLHKLCDEVFGEENFVAQITVQSNPRGRQSDIFLASVHDFLLIYAKNAWECVLSGAPLSDDQRKEFSFVDDIGNYRLLGLRQRGSASRREDRPDMYFPIYVDLTTRKVSLTKTDNSVAVLPKKSDGTDGRWMWGKEKCQTDITRLVSKMIERRGEYDIFVKDYLFRDKGERTRKYKTIWDSKEYNNQYGTQEVKALIGNGFSFPKSSRLLLDIINMGTILNNNDIILDFFSGSATTAHAVMQLNAEDGGNRKFICVQLPEVTDEKSEAYKAGYKNICEIGKERIRRAGKKLTETDNQMKLNEEQKPLDIGFKVFKLDTSNLCEWDSTPIANNNINLFYQRLNDMVDSIKPDRTAMDVVYEVSLKMGIPLDVPVTYIEVNSKVCYVVGDLLLLICFAENITAEDIEAMAEYAPAKMILAEQSFADDSALSNAHYILRDRGIELKLI